MLLVTLNKDFQALHLSTMWHPHMHHTNPLHNHLTQVLCPLHLSPSWAASSVLCRSTAMVQAWLLQARDPLALCQPHHCRLLHDLHSRPFCNLDLKFFHHHPPHSMVLVPHLCFHQCTGQTGSLGLLLQILSTSPHLFQARPWVLDILHSRPTLAPRWQAPNFLTREASPEVLHSWLVRHSPRRSWILILSLAQSR